MESFEEIRHLMFSVQTNEANKSRSPEACIMIIDDDTYICETLTTLLQTRYCVVSCASLEEAEKKLSWDTKLVLLDIKMGARDGVEVFKLLRANRPHLPILFHSAYPGSSEKTAAFEQLGHNGYLTKGEYDLSELLTTIEQAVNQSPDCCVFAK